MPATGKLAAVVAPGASGSATQPIVVRLAARLQAAGIEALPVGFPMGSSPSAGGYARQIEVLRQARDTLLGLGAERVALVGRSFGGRMSARLAAEEPPAALVILGHPISPPRRPRPDDEEALRRVQCPTLVVQGERDELGPLEVLRRIAAENSNVEIAVLAGVGHTFGKREAEGLAIATEWLQRIA
jgi:uncharacterized protein